MWSMRTIEKRCMQFWLEPNQLSSLRALNRSSYAAWTHNPSRKKKSYSDMQDDPDGIADEAISTDIYEQHFQPMRAMPMKVYIISKSLQSYSCNRKCVRFTIEIDKKCCVCVYCLGDKLAKLMDQIPRPVPVKASSAVSPCGATVCVIACICVLVTLITFSMWNWHRRIAGQYQRTIKTAPANNWALCSAQCTPNQISIVHANASARLHSQYQLAMRTEQSSNCRYRLAHRQIHMTLYGISHAES